MGETRVLRAANVASLDDVYATMLDGRRGRTVFVAGDDATGRRDLLREWAAGLGGRGLVRPAVVGGVFEGERYVPWGDDVTAAFAGREAVDTALAMLQDGITLGRVLLPPGIELLLGHIASVVKAGANLIATAIAAADRPAEAPVLAVALEGLCRRGPAVCIIESVDEQAGKLWSELAWLLSRHIARALPLLLVLGLDGPRDLGERVDRERTPSASLVS